MISRKLPQINFKFPNKNSIKPHLFGTTPIFHGQHHRLGERRRGHKDASTVVDELIDSSRMKFMPKRSRNVRRKGKCKIKSGRREAGRGHCAALPESIKLQGIGERNTLEDGLKAIDKISLPENFKCCFSLTMTHRVLWPMMMYEISMSRELKSSSNGTI